jgi:hypothetical protein
MFDTAFDAEVPGDPYDGVPLGVEAIVPFVNEETDSERSHDDDRPAARAIPARDGWRG